MRMPSLSGVRASASKKKDSKKKEPSSSSGEEDDSGSYEYETDSQDDDGQPAHGHHLHAKAIASKIKQGAGSAATKTRDSTKFVKSKVVDTAGVVGTKVADTAGAARDAATKGISNQIEEISGAIENAMETVVSSSLDQVKEIIKASAKDPEMPNIVKRGVDSFIDSIYPEIKEEALDSILQGVRTLKEPEDHPPPSWWPNPYYAFRAWFLYTMFPHNRTFWYQVKDPFWWFWTLGSLVPVYGVSQMYYLIVLFMKDGFDEYQLVNFIVSFKATQFFSVGVFPAMIAGVQYYFCATFHLDPADSTCNTSGPRVEYVGLIFFCVQILLVWFAAVRLPFSTKKGARLVVAKGSLQRTFDKDGDGYLNPDELAAFRSYLQEHGRSTKALEDETTMENHLRSYSCCCGATTCVPSRGGVLPYFVLYDFFIVLITAGLIIAAIYTAPETQLEGDLATQLPSEWQLNTTIYWCRVLYGVLSLPFLLFSIPGFAFVFTHSKATAYNRAGETVPFHKPIPPEESPADVEEGEESDVEKGKAAGSNPAHTAVTAIRTLAERIRNAFGLGSKANDDGVYSESHDD